MTMVGFYVEVAVLGHPRFKAAGGAASWLWTQAGVWSVEHGADGFVSPLAVRAYGTTAQARRLVEVGLWEEVDGGFRFLKWRNGHPTPETDEEERRRKAAERSRRYRERHAKRDDRHAENVTRDVTRDVTRHVRHAGLDTASSLQVPPLSPPQGGEPPTKTSKPRTRGSLLPASWRPLERHVEFAATNRLILDDEVVRFREHHGFKGTLGKDWNLGFDTWLRNAVKFREKDAATTAAKPAPVDWMNR